MVFPIFSNYSRVLLLVLNILHPVRVDPPFPPPFGESFLSYGNYESC